MVTKAASWSDLDKLAAADMLRLEPDAAKNCAKACADLIQRLDNLGRWGESAPPFTGTGNLPFWYALERKFSDKPKLFLNVRQWNIEFDEPAAIVLEAGASKKLDEALPDAKEAVDR